MSIALSLFILSFGVKYAGELPIIELDEGENTITLSVVNKMNNDFAGVTIEVNSYKLHSFFKTLFYTG